MNDARTPRPTTTDTATATSNRMIQHGVFAPLALFVTGALTYVRVIEPHWFIALVLVMGGWAPTTVLFQLIQAACGIVAGGLPGVHTDRANPSDQGGSK